MNKPYIGKVIREIYPDVPSLNRLVLKCRIELKKSDGWKDGDDVEILIIKKVGG